MSILGFSISSGNGGGDFAPIIKYDARAGRIFRVDREQDAGGNYFNENADITGNFKAIFDLENIETGWLNFAPGQPPSMTMVKIADLKHNPLPPAPTPAHKNGVRLTVKLHTSCGGDKPVRELAGTSKQFLSAIEALYAEYLRDRERNGGKLPVVTMNGTTPVKSGSGSQTSTNYRPEFVISGWSPRPADLGATPANAPRQPVEPLPLNPNVSPSTGSTRVNPPAKKQPVMPEVTGQDDADFG